MKFVAAHDRAGAAERAVGEKPRAAVAEMKSASGEARGVAEQAGHGVQAPVGILQALAQHHVAAALAVHRTVLRKAPQVI